MERASGVLVRARALLDTEEKWWRGHGPRPAACHCPETAICYVTECEDEAEITARRYYVRGIGVDTFIADWNDAPERTHAEVLDAFDRAIAAALSDEAAQAQEAK